MESAVRRIAESLVKLQKQLNTALAQHPEMPVTLPQLMLLKLTRQHGPYRLTALAEKIEVKPSAVTVMVDRLEKRGLVRRAQDPADRRAVLVELTAEGAETLRKADELRSELLVRLMERLEPAEVRLLADLLGRLAGTEEQARP
jgi:DNA-binding MarR family transcriptional regulator